MLFIAQEVSAVVALFLLRIIRQCEAAYRLVSAQHTNLDSAVWTAHECSDCVVRGVDHRGCADHMCPEHDDGKFPFEQRS